jgi:hypothetical protein
MLLGFLCLSRIETMCKWLRFNSKKASNEVSNCQICKCSFSTKIGTGKLGRISIENQSQTSNREGSRATTIALMRASLSPLLQINCLTYQIVCAILVGGEKYEIYFSYVIW